MWKILFISPPAQCFVKANGSDLLVVLHAHAFIANGSRPPLLLLQNPFARYQEWQLFSDDWSECVASPSRRQEDISEDKMTVRGKKEWSEIES